MKTFSFLLAAIVSIGPFVAAQTQTASAGPTVKSVTVEEVLLDIVARDKKGKPVTDLEPGDITVFDNGIKQTLTSFRLVQGKEAVNPKGSSTALEPLRQLRLVTLAFDALGAADQRKTARTAALDLIKSEQGTNVFYSVVVINTRLLALQPFTNNKEALEKAIEEATNGLAAGTLTSESNSILQELKRDLNGQTVNGADQNVNLLTSASQTAAATSGSGPPSGGGEQFVQAKLASVMLDMLRLDSSVASQGTRMTLSALEALVRALQSMPGRKSILYFTSGLYVTPELDVPFRNIMSMANRANVTFYAIDTRGVMVSAQNTSATAQLNGAARAAGTTVQRTSGPVTKEEVLASDNAEVAGRSNVQLAIRDLAESTGGFLIGDSNDLRGPLHRVSEEIASYYELTFDPGIKNYDGSFRKIAVSSSRKDLIIHARNGYFALPPDARAGGLQTFELPLLKALSNSGTSADVEFRCGAVLLKPSADGTAISVLVEVPLHALQPRIDAAKKTTNVHFSLGALVKNGQGEVVEKLTRDRSLQVTAEQLKGGNFVDKLPAVLAPGKYTLESAVMDLESGKIGTQRSDFTIAASGKGVGISSLTAVRSYAPNAKGIDPNEPFQYQGGTITPTLNTSVSRSPDSALRLFFTVYPDAAIAGKPTVEIEFTQNGNVLQKVPMPLPAADAEGRIPYVMTIPAAAIPPGVYQIRATAKQGDTSSQAVATVKIEAT
jgi:VWFA-related protein